MQLLLPIILFVNLQKTILFLPKDERIEVLEKEIRVKKTKQEKTIKELSSITKKGNYKKDIKKYLNLGNVDKAIYIMKEKKLYDIAILREALKVLETKKEIDEALSLIDEALKHQDTEILHIYKEWFMFLKDGNYNRLHNNLTNLLVKLSKEYIPLIYWFLGYSAYIKKDITTSLFYLQKIVFQYPDFEMSDTACFLAFKIYILEPNYKEYKYAKLFYNIFLKRAKKYKIYRNSRWKPAIKNIYSRFLLQNS